MRLAAPRQQFVFDMSGCAIKRSKAAEFSHLHFGLLCVAKLSLDRNTQDSYHYLYSVKMTEVLEKREGFVHRRRASWLETCDDQCPDHHGEDRALVLFGGRSQQQEQQQDGSKRTSDMSRALRFWASGKSDVQAIACALVSPGPAAAAAKHGMKLRRRFRPSFTGVEHR
jgi:hypothetical protein